MSVDKIVKKAQSFIGCKESDGSHKKIIDYYNNNGSLPQGYKVKYTDAWCATYVSVVFMQGATKNWKYKECSCDRMIKLFKSNNKYITDKSKAKAGDVIFYDWQANGASSDHVGIIVGSDSTHWTVIEGNKNDEVGYRQIAKTSDLIMGYGVIDYNNADIVSKYYCDKYKKYCDG